ncbi:MAG: hypothetical protein ACOYEJ_01500 [Mahellales bacterium]|jgi:hypothetical protein
MRKFLPLLILIFLIFCSTGTAYGAISPLGLQGRSACQIVDPTISMESFKAIVDVQNDISHVTTTSVIKNNSDEEKSVLMGYGDGLIGKDDTARISNFTISVDNIRYKYVLRNGVANPDNSQLPSFTRWFAWDLRLQPGEAKVVKNSFTLKNKLFYKGNYSVELFLQSLVAWQQPIKQVEIVYDFGEYRPYIFDPSPQPQPTTITEGGQLIWRYTDYTPTTDSNFTTFFFPMDIATTNLAKGKGDKQLSAIANDYLNTKYSAVITKANEYLMSEESQYKKEAMYFMARAAHSLMDLDTALELYDKIVDNPGFSDDIAPVLTQQLIYEKISILKYQQNMERVRETIEQTRAMEPNYLSYPIQAWLEKESSLLPKPQPQPEQTTEEQPKQDDTTTNIKEGLEILGYDVPIELIIIVILLILFIILRTIFKRKRKRRKSLFY